MEVHETGQKPESSFLQDAPKNIHSGATSSISASSAPPSSDTSVSKVRHLAKEVLAAVKSGWGSTGGAIWSGVKNVFFEHVPGLFAFAKKLEAGGLKRHNVDAGGSCGFRAAAAALKQADSGSQIDHTTLRQQVVAKLREKVGPQKAARLVERYHQKQAQVQTALAAKPESTRTKKLLRERNALLKAVNGDPTARALNQRLDTLREKANDLQGKLESLTKIKAPTEPQRELIKALSELQKTTFDPTPGKLNSRINQLTKALEADDWLVNQYSKDVHALFGEIGELAKALDTTLATGMADHAIQHYHANEDNAVDKYLEMMGKETTYMGDVELAILPNILGRPIQVYKEGYHPDPTKSYRKYSSTPEEGPSQEPVRLFHWGALSKVSDLLGNHYNWLEPTNNPSEKT